MNLQKKRLSVPMKKKHQAGVAIIEALFALFILLVGLLGIAGVQMKMMQSNAEAYQRAQALVLLSDMVERFNAHRQLAGCLTFTDNIADGSPYLGFDVDAADVIPDCDSTNGTPDASVNLAGPAQLEEWHALLLGSNETRVSGSGAGASTRNVGGPLRAVGCVSEHDEDGMTVYTFAIAWQGLYTLFAPPVDEVIAAKNCGRGLYGNDAQRRLVWTSVRAASLR